MLKLWPAGDDGSFKNPPLGIMNICADVLILKKKGLLNIKHRKGHKNQRWLLKLNIWSHDLSVAPLVSTQSGAYYGLVKGLVCCLSWPLDPIAVRGAFFLHFCELWQTDQLQKLLPSLHKFLFASDTCKPLHHGGLWPLITIPGLHVKAGQFCRVHYTFWTWG